MLSVVAPVRALVYVTTLGLKALLFSLSSVLDVAARTFFNQKSRLLENNMDSGDHKNVSSVPVAEESRGGLKFEVIYAEPTSPPPRTQPLSPKSVFSVENIDNKLKAADDRRRTLEAAKLQQANEKNTRIEEVNLKKQEANDNFKQNSKIQLENKIVKTTEAREAQITALLERLREHDKHIADVRKQLDEQVNEQTDQLRDRLQKKLEQAQEKRQTMLKDLQDKQTEHLQHVQEIRMSKVAQSPSNENAPVGNENENSFSG